MSGPGPVTPPASPAWDEYLAEEHRARNGYLLVVQHAHHEYLTGPWPDRDAYDVVERHAWATYYHAGRSAWIRYRDALNTPPPPPLRPAGYAPSFPPAYAGNDNTGQGFSQPGSPYPAASGTGWPAAPDDYRNPGNRPYPEREA